GALACIGRPARRDRGDRLGNDGFAWRTTISTSRDLAGARVARSRRHERPLGLRLWSIASRVQIHARTNCNDVRLTTRSRTLYDRVPAANPASTSRDLGAMRVHATRTVTAEASGDAGDDVLLHVVATCDRSTVSAERRLSL